MKPSITVDERGIILHVTTATGEGVAVPLNAELVTEAKNAFAKLATPEGKRRVLHGLGRLFSELTEPEKEDDGKKV